MMAKSVNPEIKLSNKRIGLLKGARPLLNLYMKTCFI